MQKDHFIQGLISSLKLLKEKENAGNPEEYEDKIKQNPNDHESRFNLANSLLAIDEKDKAIDHLLEIVKLDRKWKEDKARKKIIEILNANSEDDLFTANTRQKLSNILFV